MIDATLKAMPEAGAGPLADAEARARVQDVLRGLAKAWRTYLLYEGHSPALDRIVEQLRANFRDLFLSLPFFTVRVEERELLWSDLPVYQGEDGSDQRPGLGGRDGGFRENLAFVMYRDGLRELSFHRGVEREELDALLEVLASVTRMRGDDQDDLLTLLWSHDWIHLRYRYVEGLPDGTVLPAACCTSSRRPTFPARRCSRRPPCRPTTSAARSTSWTPTSCAGWSASWSGRCGATCGRTC